MSQETFKFWSGLLYDCRQELIISFLFSCPQYKPFWVFCFVFLSQFPADTCLYISKRMWHLRLAEIHFPFSFLTNKIYTRIKERLLFLRRKIRSWLSQEIRSCTSMEMIPFKLFRSVHLILCRTNIWQSGNRFKSIHFFH